MNKVALIDETGGGYPEDIVLALVYFPEKEGIPISFDDFYEDLSSLEKKLPAYFTNVTKPLIGAGCSFPAETTDFFSAEMRCRKSEVYSENPEKTLFQRLNDLGYRTRRGYRLVEDRINMEQIKSLFSETL